MNEIDEILERIRIDPESVFKNFEESLNAWEEFNQYSNDFDNFDDSIKIKIIKDAYMKKINEKSNDIIPSPVEDKDYSIFVGSDSNGEIIVKFEAYSEIGQILMQKMASDSMDIGISWDDIDK